MSKAPQTQAQPQQPSAATPIPTNPDNNMAPEINDEAKEFAEKYPQYKYYKFSDDSVYFGETATITKENKIIPNVAEITDPQVKASLIVVRHGYGIMLYELKENDKFSSKYEGMWHFNKRKGKGKATYSDGSVYEGEFDCDLYEGQGKLIMKQGYSYTGCWSNGRMEGEGEFKHPDKHILKGLFKNNYYFCKEQNAFINPFLSFEEMESFKLKNTDFISKSKPQFEKFSRENWIRITNQIELIQAIDDTYKNNKIPLLWRCEDKMVTKQEVYALFHNNYREIDWRYSYNKLHETILSFNTKIFEEIKQNVTEAMTHGLFLIWNFDDCKENFTKSLDPDIREFYGNMMLSPFMWNPSLFSQPKLSQCHWNNRQDLKMDKNFKLICYSKFLVDDKLQEHDWINGIEKRFEKSFPLVNMNVLIYSNKKKRQLNRLNPRFVAASPNQPKQLKHWI